MQMRIGSVRLCRHVVKVTQTARENGRVEKEEISDNKGCNENLPPSRLCKPRARAIQMRRDICCHGFSVCFENGQVE